jgi:hypothetical protein
LPLIDLIQATTGHGLWDNYGGRGSVQPFGTPLNLVIRQTKSVHDKIAELLHELRQLHDLQTAITVEIPIVEPLGPDKLLFKTLSSERLRGVARTLLLITPEIAVNEIQEEVLGPEKSP